MQETIYVEDGQRIVLRDCSYREVVYQFQAWLIKAMERHGFQKDKIDDMVTVLKELLSNLLHHDYYYEPNYLYVEVKFINSRAIELILEDHEAGEIKVDLEKARNAANQINEESDLSEIPETGRGYFIISELANVSFIVNQSHHHVILVKIPKDQDNWGFSFVLDFVIMESGLKN